MKYALPSLQLALATPAIAAPPNWAGYWAGPGQDCEMAGEYGTVKRMTRFENPQA